MIKRDSAGNELASPLTIVRRLVVLPFFFVARCLFVATIALGWGVQKAKMTWTDTE